MKPAVKIASKSNEYSLGSTLVLTVNEDRSRGAEPSYVDQTQPHKMVKPLRFEPQVGPLQAQNNHAAEKRPLRTRPVIVEPQPEIVPQTQNFANSGYDSSPIRKESAPIYNGNYEKSSVQDSEEYPYVERQTEPPKPYRQEVYDQQNVKSRPESFNPPPRKSEYEDVYASDQKVSYREPEDDRYEDISAPSGQRREMNRPHAVEKGPVRPSYEESRPTYVDLRPSHEAEPVRQDQRRPIPQSENNEYAGM